MAVDLRNDPVGRKQVEGQGFCHWLEICKFQICFCYWVALLLGQVPLFEFSHRHRAEGLCVLQRQLVRVK